MTRARTEAAERNIETQKWQGKLINNRLTDDESIGPHCFHWLTNWEDCPSETIHDVEEIYQRLVLTKVYYRDKLRYQVDSTIRQLCKEQPETVAHILAGCSALAQHHYTARHNAGLKCLYFTLLKHYELVNKIPPWHLAIEPKPEVKNDQLTHTQTETDRQTDKERQTEMDLLERVTQVSGRQSWLAEEW